MHMKTKIAHLSDSKHAIKIAKQIIKGNVVVMDYGSTFGTAFTPGARQKVAKLRKEIPPYATVSLVATYQQTIDFIDHPRLHPHIKNAVENDALKFFEYLAFLRLPANQKARNILGSNYVNPQNEFQVFIVPDSDPLISALLALGHTPFYAVRSSNLTGKPEEYTVQGALEYARKINSPVLAVTHPEKHTSPDTRKRVRSQPILHFPENSLEIVLARMGSTHPEALEIIINHLFPQATFSQHEEKKAEYRTQYHPKDDNVPLDAVSIRDALLTAAGLLR